MIDLCYTRIVCVVRDKYGNVGLEEESESSSSDEEEDENAEVCLTLSRSLSPKTS